MMEPAGTVVESVEVPLHAVERELAKGLRSLYGPGGTPVYKARMSNLVIYCVDESRFRQVEAMIPAIVAIHPARVILLLADDSSRQADIQASVLVRKAGHGTRMTAEQVTLRGGLHASDHLPFAVRSLLIGDLPTNVWWTSPTPPPLAGPVLDDLCEHAQQLIYDSLGWAAPHQAVASTSAWLSRFERDGEGGRWRVASDLNWRRLKYWRRLISQEMSPTINPGAIDSIFEVLIEHGTHAVTQAWQLAAWLASRLGWKFQTSRIKIGTDIVIQLSAPRGALRLRINRLPEGPSEIRRVHVACTIAGQIGALDFVVADDGRLSVQREALDSSPRTVSIPSLEIAEIVAKQLSDREPDSVFREMIKASHALAQTMAAY